MQTAQRQCGIFMPVSSLPNEFGVGGFGSEARTFIDFIAETNLSHWQVLPFSYSYGSISPYSGSSSFAIHHLFVDPSSLHHDGHISPPTPPEAASADRVDATILDWKHQLLNEAYETYKTSSTAKLRADFREFLVEHADWILDFSLYVALTEHFQHKSWQNWPTKFRNRDPRVLNTWEVTLHHRVERAAFAQFLLYRQWEAVHSYAHSKGVSIIGDLPIYSNEDSADVWLHQDLYLLNAHGRPSHVSGCPPDMFTKEGQRWGMPLYNWKAIAEEKYSFLITRFSAQFSLVDTLRIDHFLGYIRAWSIPNDAKPTDGVWLEGPGDDFLNVLKAHIPSDRFIVEDLGIHNDHTRSVMKNFGAPNMRVMTVELNLVTDFDETLAYPIPGIGFSSTHDTNTLVGWYEEQTPETKAKLQTWWNAHGVEALPLQFRFIYPILQSPAQLVILPLEDILGLGSDSRINWPGTVGPQNWTWRFTWDDIDRQSVQILRDGISASGRV